MSAPLVFTRNGRDSWINQQYYRLSTCGRYSVAKVLLQDAWVYEAWRLRPTATCLGRSPSDALAQKRCQRDADTHATPEAA